MRKALRALFSDLDFCRPTPITSGMVAFLLLKCLPMERIKSRFEELRFVLHVLVLKFLLCDLRLFECCRQSCASAVAAVGMPVDTELVVPDVDAGLLMVMSDVSRSSILSRCSAVLLATTALVVAAATAAVAEAIVIVVAVLVVLQPFAVVVPVCSLLPNVNDVAGGLELLRSSVSIAVTLPMAGKQMASMQLSRLSLSKSSRPV